MSVDHNPYAPPQADVVSTVARDSGGGSAVRWLAAIYCAGPVLFYALFTLPLVYTVAHGRIHILSWAMILVPLGVRMVAGVLLLIRREAVSAWLLLGLCVLKTFGLLNMLRLVQGSAGALMWLPLAMSFADLALLTLITRYAFIHRDRSQR
jgi:hypothetical protein